MNGIPTRTGKPMESSEATERFQVADIIKVPFPYTDRATRQRRPALVVSTPSLQELHGLLWVVMVTSAENRRWPSDIPIDDLDRAGLPAPSLIRPAKIATIDARDGERLGRIGPDLWTQVAQSLQQQIGAAS